MVNLLKSMRDTLTVDDVESVNQLAERLRDRDVANTLNNVLEWVEKNVFYWRERGYLILLYGSTLFLCLYGVFILLLVTQLIGKEEVVKILLHLSVSLSWYQHFPLFGPTAIIGVLVQVSLALFYIIIVILLLSIICKFASVLFSTLTVWMLLIIVSKTGVLSQILTLFPVYLQWMFSSAELIAWITIGASLSTLAYFLTIYSFFYVRDGGKRRFAKILTLMELTFQPIISVREILEYKLAVCRDYAKLLASILVNLYPDRNIYFLRKPRHVATAIEFEGKLYVLDQKLPIMSLDAWMRRLGVKCAKKYLLVRSKDGGFSVKHVGEVTVEEDTLDLNLSEDLRKLADIIYRAIENGQKSAQYVLRAYGKMFNIYDPIIKESLKRAIRTVVEKELVVHRHLIKEFKIMKLGEDIEVNVEFERDYSGTV
ncbi:MAG: transglutaminase-like domain-containing protein [Nitrososphaerota archaeon]